MVSTTLSQGEEKQVACVALYFPYPSRQVPLTALPLRSALDLF